ncbi:MAG: hypothetical protein AAFW68_10735 [Pseudomonadota bacterium]
MANAYDVVMDAEKNPLSRMRKAQRFQLMTYLSLMWTTIFCAGFGFWAIYGQLVVLHVLLALGVAFTATTFVNARRTHRDVIKREDDTARYDDIWGAP